MGNWCRRIFAASMVALMAGCATQAASNFRPSDASPRAVASGGKQIRVMKIVLVSADRIVSEDLQLLMEGYRFLGESNYKDETDGEELEDAFEQARAMGADALLIAKQPLTATRSFLTISYPDVCRTGVRDCVEQRTLFGRRLISNGFYAVERIENITQPVEHILRFYSKDAG